MSCVCCIVTLLRDLKCNIFEDNRANYIGLIIFVVGATLMFEITAILAKNNAIINLTAFAGNSANYTEKTIFPFPLKLNVV